MKKHSHLRAALVTLVAIASIATMSARAEIFTETVGGYTWSYYIENGGARIYKGSGKAAISPVPEGLVEIPDTLDGYPVTSIGSCAFTDCSGMTGVTIPGSVASIGSSAFYNCTNLTSVTIPAGVTSLGRWAFNGCHALTNVTMPSRLTSIEEYMFSQCYKLASISIPDGVTDIGTFAFDRCRALTSVVIPDGVTNIAYAAFVACSGLRRAIVPDSVTSIEGCAFEGVNSEAVVFVGNGVTNIAGDAFGGTGHVKPKVYVSNLYAGPVISGAVVGLSLSPSGAQTLVAPTAVSASCTISGATMRYTTDGTAPTAASPVFAPFTVSEPMTVTVGAFLDGIRVLTTKAVFNPLEYTWSYRIVDGGAEIYKADDQAAISPAPVGAVEIPATLGGYPVTSIGSHAFYQCSGMTGVTIPAGVTRIGWAAFNGCSGLTSVTIPAGVTSIGDLLFYECRNLASIAIPAGVTSIGERAFYHCQALTSVAIPDGVTSIGYGAFLACTGLRRVTIPDSVTSIEGYAFNCITDTAVFVGNGVTNIGNNAFGVAGQTMAKAYVSDLYAGPMADGITVGLSLSPSGEQPLTEPKAVSATCAIEDAVLRYTTDGTMPTATSPVFAQFTVMEPMTLTVGAFLDGERVLWTRAVFTPIEYTWSYRIVNGGAEIYKAGSQAAISPAPVGPVEIPATLGGYPVTSIGDYAFYLCQNMTSVTIPSTVTNIGANAFWYCIHMKQADLPAGVKAIGEKAFYDCTRLERLRLPDGLGTIGSWAFYCCEALTSVTIPDSVANIPPRAFRSCTGLTHMFVGNSVTNIGYEAFYGIPSAKFYVSDIYAGPAMENKYIALMLSLPGERDLPEPKTVAAALSVPGSVLRYTTDGTIPTESSPVFETFRVTDSMTLTVGAFLDGERVLWTRAVYTKAWTWLEETVGGRSWAYRIVNGEATTVLRAYDSQRGTYSPTVWPSSAGAVEIPSTLGGCPVTRIGEDSFRQYAGLTGVTIPTNVTVIASGAFRDCTGLTRVVIPDGVTTIAAGAFNGCTGMEAIFIGNGVTSIGTGALNNLGSAVRYISDIYAGPAISGAVVGLSLSPSGEQTLDEPTAVTATCAVPGATMRYTTDGTTPTAASPVFAPFTVSASTTVTVGAFLDGQRVLTTRGVYTYMSGFVSLGGKGTIVEQDGGYFATANDGVTLVEGDFIFKLSSQAYTIDIAVNGKTATVRLKKPEIGTVDGGNVVATPDPDDPLHMLVIVAAEHMSAIPTAGSGQAVRVLPVKTYPGLWYRASWGDALTGFTDGAKVQATGDALYLGVIRQEGQQGFYRLTVSEE